MDDTALSRHDSDKRVVRTKKAIRTALFGIMEKKDIADITVSELTLAADVNRLTFYTHYHSIEDILSEVENDFMGEMEALANSVSLSELRAGVDRMFSSLDELILGEYCQYFRVVRIEMRGVFYERLKGLVRIMTDKLVELICEKHGENASVISTFIMGGFFNSYLEWHRNSDKTEELYKRTVGLVCDMVELCLGNA